ncbi:MAG: phosphoenolpyruvate synthase [Candidatus Hadarchaeota archaeon]
MLGVIWLSDLSKNDIPIAGGKGANLGELLRNEIPVPNGFVVDSRTFMEFIERTGIKDDIKKILDEVDVEKTDDLNYASQKIREEVESKEMLPEIKKEIKDAYNQLCEEEGEQVFVAIRSSATAEDLPEASFAGQQETFLNIHGPDDVVEKVRKCWSSLYTPRAIYYRVRHKFTHEDVSIAVVVQKMINSEKSGVMFTSHPVTGEKMCIVEAVFGLGEAIVSGSVTPDSYVYDRNKKEIVETKVAKKNFMLVRQDGKTVEVKLDDKKANERVLTDAELREVFALGEVIEEHYGWPQDVEWAVENGKVYITQSRPVTTIKEGKEKAEAGEFEEGEVLIKGLGAAPGIGVGKVKIVLEEKEVGKVKEGDILVTTMTSPDMVPAMQRASAIVTDEGGMTCHAAIVSRELGVPAIVGTGKGTKVLEDGAMVTVDGDRGVVYSGKVKKEEKKEEAVTVGAGPIITATEVKVNLSIPDAAEKAAATGADGVGLFRIEHMVLGLDKHPMKYIKDGEMEEYIDLLARETKKVAKAFYPKPIWVRSLDAPTDEFRGMVGGEDEPIEANPMLGFRGIRRDLKEEEHFRAELKAMKRLVDEGFTNIGIMLPLVGHPSEVRRAKQILHEEGLDTETIDFGVMVETPAAALVIEEIIDEGITFASFGTNDLTQYTLAVDRNNENVAYLYKETHPAVMRLIERVILICREHGVKTSICGQAGSYPNVVDKLVRLGIDSVSANPDAVKTIRETVAKVEKRIMLDESRRKD